MKKTLSFLMIVCMLASLFISCDAAIADDQHVSVSFSTTSSRSLTTDTKIDSLDNYVWWYKANTTDSNANFQYGSTGRNTWVKVGDGTPDAGKLSGMVVISRGIWDFDLCGVRKATEESGDYTPSENPTMIVYSGSASGKLVDKDVNKIDIEVSASPTGTGKISIAQEILIQPADSSSQEGPVYANTYSIVKSDGTNVDGHVGIISIPATLIEVPAGDYKVTVYYKETSGNLTYEIASEEVSITVYGDSTVSISGTLNEETQGIKFNAISQFEVSSETTVPKGSEKATLKSTVTPAMSYNSQEKTVVEVPASLLGVNANTPKDVQLLVKVTPVAETSSAGFSIMPSAGSSLVAGINLSLATKNNQGQYVAVDYTENTDPITVTTYVAKDLVNPSVRYVGAVTAQPTLVSYEASTGKIIFTTTHFSTFVVESDSEALIGDSAYLTLSDAINSVKSDETITLLKDITLQNNLDIANGKTFNLDLNGHNINCGNNSICILSYDDNRGGELNIVGAGSIIGSRDIANNQWSAWTFQLRGENNRSSSEKCNLSIGKDVTVDSPFAISILSKNNTSTSFGVNVDIYGTVTGPEPIYVSGNINGKNGDEAETDFTNYPVINIHDGAEIICENGETVYLAGYAKTTIGNAILTSDANCITIAAGELTVNGATITGGTSFNFNPGGGGSITFDEASAIYVKQHETNLPLIVTVNSGTLSGAVPFYQAKGQSGDNARPDLVNLSITGGEFICTASYGEETAIISDDKTGFITGGSFSTNPSVYVPFGYNVDLDGDKYVVSEASSLEIKSADDLMKFAAAVNSGNNYSGKTIILRNNVDLTGKTWVPIGQKDGNKFSGTFDGNSKEISGLDIIETNDTAIKTTPFDGYVGLFGAINGATIKDLTVRGSVKGSNAAGIVARMDTGLIDNCKSYVNVVGASKVAEKGKAGGIVCLTNAGNGDCTISNCLNYGSVSTTTEDDNDGFVAGTTGGVAGIVGYVNKNTSITSCKNYGSIGSSYDKYGAGIAGYVTTGGNINISECINEGPVTASLNAGGIVGCSTGVNSIESCSNNNSITASGSDGVAAGIAARTADTTITSCSNNGTVYGAKSGSIVGWTVGNTTIDNIPFVNPSQN